MLEWFLNAPLAVREVLNGAAFPLSVMLLLIIGWYLFETYRRYGHGWTREPGVATACALAWMFFAESCRAGIVWYALRVQNDGGKLTDTFKVASNIILVVAGVVLVLSLLRCTFIFTPPHLGNWTWIVSLFITATFLSFSLIY